MNDIIEGFLKFQREAFPRRSELLKRLATGHQPDPTHFIHRVLRQSRRSLSRRSGVSCDHNSGREAL